MAELRRDPVSGRWVIIAAERSLRPNAVRLSRGTPRGGFCPFCEGNEDRTPPEVMAIRPAGTPANSPGWSVRVVPNKFPALRTDVRMETGGQGVYETVAGFGRHEVIIESPRHIVSLTEMGAEHLAQVVEAYCERSRVLSEDKRLAYVLIFKNVGEAAGATVEHSHSQLIAVPVMPKRVQTEMDRCAEYYEATGRCLFCDIIAQEEASGERIVADCGDFLVLSPFAARFPFEMWVLPKFHAPHLFELTPPQAFGLAEALHQALARLEVCLGDPPYNCAVHSAPVAGQGQDHYHWHVELMPRVTHVAGFEWGTGFHINPLAPETAAQYLREVAEEQVRAKVGSEYVPESAH